MWLLDHNIPHQLAFVLRDLGIVCETAFVRKWHELHNGDLIQAAIDAGFNCILTKDVGFMSSAKTHKHKRLTIVVVVMPQARWPTSYYYLPMAYIFTKTMGQRTFVNFTGALPLSSACWARC